MNMVHLLAQPDLVHLGHQIHAYISPPDSNKVVRVTSDDNDLIFWRDGLWMFSAKLCGNPGQRIFRMEHEEDLWEHLVEMFPPPASLLAPENGE